jgi:hypothetical protein
MAVCSIFAWQQRLQDMLEVAAPSVVIWRHCAWWCCWQQPLLRVSQCTAQHIAGVPAVRFSTLWCAAISSAVAIAHLAVADCYALVCVRQSFQYFAPALTSVLPVVAVPVLVCSSPTIQSAAAAPACSLQFHVCMSCTDVHHMCFSRCVACVSIFLAMNHWQC